MHKIDSFQIDHTRLDSGLYLSRKDKVGEEEVLTYDIRLKRPNRDVALTSAVAHTIEHLGATFLRQQSPLKEQVIYFGPMGCLTGFYLILGKQITPAELSPLITDLFRFIVHFEGEVPGATPRECGNHTLMDLKGAREEGRRYLCEVLEEISKENLTYPIA